MNEQFRKLVVPNLDIEVSEGQPIVIPVHTYKSWDSTGKLLETPCLSRSGLWVFINNSQGQPIDAYVACDSCPTTFGR